jgi:hypothetical protein
MDCSGSCNIKGLIAGEQVDAVKNLFKLAQLRAPEGELFGVIDGRLPQTAYACPSLCIWGYTYYCTNRERLKGMT